MIPEVVSIGGDLYRVRPMLFGDELDNEVRQIASKHGTEAARWYLDRIEERVGPIIDLRAQRAWLDQQPTLGLIPRRTR